MVIAVVATAAGREVRLDGGLRAVPYTFRGREAFYLLFDLGLLFPLDVAALPLFLLLQQIGLNDNLFGVALPEAAFSLPVTIVILRPFMRAVPGELEDAAIMDGATRIRFFLRILLPLSRPALITVGSWPSSRAGTPTCCRWSSSAARTTTPCRWPWRIPVHVTRTPRGSTRSPPCP